MTGLSSLPSGRGRPGSRRRERRWSCRARPTPSCPRRRRRRGRCRCRSRPRGRCCRGTRCKAAASAARSSVPSAFMRSGRFIRMISTRHRARFRLLPWEPPGRSGRCIEQAQHTAAPADSSRASPAVYCECLRPPKETSMTATNEHTPTPTPDTSPPRCTASASSTSRAPSRAPSRRCCSATWAPRSSRSSRRAASRAAPPACSPDGFSSVLRGAQPRQEEHHARPQAPRRHRGRQAPHPHRRRGRGELPARRHGAAGHRLRGREAAQARHHLRQRLGLGAARAVGRAAAATTTWRRR